MEIDQKPILKHKPPGNRLMRLRLETTIPLWDAQSSMFDKKDYEEFVQILYNSLQNKFTKLPFEQRKDIIHDKLLKLYELAQKGNAQLMFDSVLHAFAYVYVACIREMKKKLLNTKEVAWDGTGKTFIEIRKQTIRLSMLQMFHIHLDAVRVMSDQHKTKVLTPAETALLQAVKNSLCMDFNLNLKLSERLAQIVQQICEELEISKGNFYTKVNRLKAKLIWFYQNNELYKYLIDKMKEDSLFETEVNQT